MSTSLLVEKVSVEKVSVEKTSRCRVSVEFARRKESETYILFYLICPVWHPPTAINSNWMVTMDTKEALRSEPAIQPTAQPTVFIVVQSPEFTPDKIHFEKTFSKKLVTVLATLQLISAALAFIFQVKICVKFKVYNHFYFQDIL